MGEAGDGSASSEAVGESGAGGGRDQSADDSVDREAELRERFADRVILGRVETPAEEVATASTGSANPETERQEREAQVYEFVQPISAAGSGRGSADESGEENRAFGLEMPTSGALRKVPSRYRERPIH